MFLIPLIFITFSIHSIIWRWWLIRIIWWCWNQMQMIQQS